jgi:hypothetical protein
MAPPDTLGHSGFIELGEAATALESLESAPCGPDPHILALTH